MSNEERKIETTTHPIKSTYTVGRKVVAENGEHIVEKQDRQVVVSVTTADGGVFHRGARIA